MPSDVKLVVFDLGGVLVRICDGWKHAAQAARIGVKLKELDAATAAAVYAVVCDSETGRIEPEEFCHRVSPLLGVTPQHVSAMSNVYLLSPFPGIVELTDALKAAGCQTACLSNTNANHWRILNDRAQAAHLPLDRLNFQFASHLIGHRKPDAGAYEHVERVSKCAGPQIVFFDDVKQHVDAARTRGWQAIHIAHDGDPIRQARRHLVRLGVLK